MIAVDLSKQQALDADPRAITTYLDGVENTTMFFIVEEAKETVRIFTRNCKIFVSATSLNAIKCNFIE